MQTELRRNIVLILGLLFSMTLPTTGADIRTVNALDLEQYQGKWYEIARFPNSFQNQCKKNVMVNYTLREDGLMNVTNQCLKKDDSISAVSGLAKVIDPIEPGKLGVSFFDIFGWRPVWGNYWVLFIDPAYQVAVIGEPAKRNGWVLSRSNSLSADNLENALLVFTENGYNIEAIKMTVQD